MATSTPLQIQNNPNDHLNPHPLSSLTNPQSPSIKTPTPSSPIPTNSERYLQKTRSPLQRGLTFDLNEARSFKANAPTEEELADAELAEAAKLAFKALQNMDAVEKGGFPPGEVSC